MDRKHEASLLVWQEQFKREFTTFKLRLNWSCILHSSKQCAVRPDRKTDFNSAELKTFLLASFLFAWQVIYIDCKHRCSMLLKANAYHLGLAVGFWNTVQQNWWCPRAVLAIPPAPTLPINSENRAELVISSERIAPPCWGFNPSLERTKARRYDLKQENLIAVIARHQNNDRGLYDDSNN